jgi:hypothetical protein
MNIFSIIPFSLVVQDISPVNIHEIILYLECNSYTLTVINNFIDDWLLQSDYTANQLCNKSRQYSCFEISHL